MGVACLVRDELKDRLTLAATNEYARFMWIRARVGIPPPRDIYIAVCYFPPASSPFDIHDGVERDPYADLYADITKYSVEGEVIIMGDFNARTRDLQVPLHDRSEDEFCTRGIHPFSGYAADVRGYLEAHHSIW